MDELAILLTDYTTRACSPALLSWCCCRPGPAASTTAGLMVAASRALSRGDALTDPCVFEASKVTRRASGIGEAGSPGCWRRPRGEAAPRRATAASWDAAPCGEGDAASARRGERREVGETASPNGKGIPSSPKGVTEKQQQLFGFPVAKTNRDSCQNEEP